MEKIINFDEKVSEMKRITVCENINRRIGFGGPNGWVIVELDVIPKSEIEVNKNVFYKLEIFKSKNSKNKFKEITEEEAKEIFLGFVKDISWNSKIPDDYEKIWEKVKKRITDISNFRYSMIVGNPFSNNESSTYVGSSIFVLKKSIN